jgi:hypothetical protein
MKRCRGTCTSTIGVGRSPPASTSTTPSPVETTSIHKRRRSIGRGNMFLCFWGLDGIHQRQTSPVRGKLTWRNKLFCKNRSARVRIANWTRSWELPGEHGILQMRSETRYSRQGYVCARQWLLYWAGNLNWRRRLSFELGYAYRHTRVSVVIPGIVKVLPRSLSRD